MKFRFLINAALIVALAVIGLKFQSQFPLTTILIAALAVKHMAYILINGNLFQGLRTCIEISAKNSPAFEKCRVLFSCNLCMTTQLSIWTVALPALVIVCRKYPHPLQQFFGTTLPAEWVFTLLATFIFAMVVAALAMAWWRFLEFPAEYTEAMSALEEQKLQLARTRVTGSRTISAFELLQADVVLILAKLYTSCQDVSYCSTALRWCFRSNIPIIIAEMAKSRGWDDSDQQALLKLLGEITPKYLSEMIRQYPIEHYDLIRQNLAERLIAGVSIKQS